MWTEVVDGTALTERRGRWFPGQQPGTQRHEETWSTEGLTPEAAETVVRRAAEALQGDGWHVLAPPSGLPRVQAGRDDGLDRAELLVLVVPEDGRLVLRHRTGSHPVAPSTPSTPAPDQGGER